MSTQKQIKSFREQFVECSDKGFHKPGELLKFKDHPELLPAPWHKAAKTIAKLLKENPEEGLTPLMCLRFGGKCSSSNPECRKLRASSLKEE